METLKQDELLTSVNEVDSNDSGTVKRENVEDTPFIIISMEGYHFGVLGDYRVTEKDNDIEKIRAELKKITWNRLIQVIMILDNMKDKLEQLKTKK